MALISCYECGGTVSTSAAACPHCGAPLNALTECYECRNKLSPTDATCPHCGAPAALSADTSPSKLDESTSDKQRKIAINPTSAAENQRDTRNSSIFARVVRLVLTGIVAFIGLFISLVLFTANSPKENGTVTHPVTPPTNTGAVGIPYAGTSTKRPGDDLSVHEGPNVATPDTAAESCKVEHFIWHNVEGMKIMAVDGVVSASTTVKLIHIQYYDANGKFLGTSSAIINPGGSFKDSLPWQNSTSKLTIKYQCQQLS